MTSKGLDPGGLVARDLTPIVRDMATVLFTIEDAGIAVLAASLDTNIFGMEVCSTARKIISIFLSLIA